MRTLSARILLAFAALTVAFGVITATVVFNMRRVEQEIHLVRSGYVPLALVSKDLARREEDLKAFLEEGWSAEQTVRNARVTLAQSKNRRDVALDSLRTDVENLDQMASLDAQQTRHEIDQLQASVDALRPLYDRLLRATKDDQKLDDPAIVE